MNPKTDLPQILVGELNGTTCMFLAWFKHLKKRGFSFTEKVQISGKAGATSYDTRPIYISQIFQHLFKSNFFDVTLK